MKFKRGDKVYVVDNSNSDTPAGATGVFKRYNKEISNLCVIRRDDGEGWQDGRTLGWNVLVTSLAPLSEKFDYEMDA